MNRSFISTSFLCKWIVLLSAICLMVGLIKSANVIAPMSSMSRNFSSESEALTLPTSFYEKQKVTCFLNREKTKILRNKNHLIVTTKNVIQKGERRDFTFLHGKLFQTLNIRRDRKVTISLSQCNIMQLYYNLKIWAGRLTDDKNIVQFIYNTLRITTLASVFLNGDDKNLQINMGKAWHATHSNSYDATSLTKKTLLEYGINALGTYKQPFLNNEMNFKNDETLYSHYAILQGLRHMRIMNTKQKKLLPIFRVFELFKSNHFYRQLMEVSKNATREINLTYYYTFKNEREDYYSISLK